MEFAMQTYIVSFIVGAVVGSVTVGTIAYFHQKRVKKSHLKYGSASMTNAEHCDRCLCNNPVLSKMLLERMARQSGNANAPSSIREDTIDQFTNSNTSFNHATDWATFDDAAYKSEVEIDVSNNQSNFDHEFLKRCREPAYLQAQLKKIEDEYKEKTENLQNIRASMIAKNEAQCKKIKDEILDENFFQ